MTRDNQREDNALRTIAHEAAVLADERFNGDYVNAYAKLAAAVDAFLYGATPDEIIAAGRAAEGEPSGPCTACGMPYPGSHYLGCKDV